MRTFAWMTLALLSFACVAATRPAAQMPSFQAILDDAVAQGNPGVQAFVLRGGDDWSGVAGFASVERRRRLAANDRIRLASITKMFTYAAIMELAERGALSLSDRAVDRLPPGTLAGIPHADRITIAQLLDHMSGLHNFNGPNGADFFTELYGDSNRGRRLWRAAELLAFARRADNPPTGEPGAARSYSSTGYIVLEMIAEHVSGRPLAELYRELIFAPLGMRRTGVEGQGLTTADSVDSYGRRPDDATEPSAFTGRPQARADGLLNLSRGLTYYNAWARGAGAATSTASDLARFMRAVVDGRITVISNQAQEFAAARSQPTALLGWNGYSAGIQSSILYAPNGEIITIVLTNGTNTGRSSADIARSLLNAARAQTGR